MTPYSMWQNGHEKIMLRAVAAADADKHRLDSLGMASKYWADKQYLGDNVSLFGVTIPKKM